MTSRDLPRVLTVAEYGSDPLRALTRRGELERVRRGAYRRLTPDASRWDRSRDLFLARCHAVAARLTTTYAFSYTTAAGLRRWPTLVDPTEVHIVQRTRPTRTRAGDIRRHHRPDLTDQDIVEIDGLPVTTDTQTVLDCVLGLNPRDGLVLADHALTRIAKVSRHTRAESTARQDAVRDQWLRALADLGPVHNVQRAREVLRYANGLSGSPAESRGRWTALTAGLPEPICEWELWVDGRQYFSDMAWLAHASDWRTRAITFEYDGVDKYGTTVAEATAVIAEEKEREDAIESLGVTVHRITKQRLASPERARRWMLSKFPASMLATLESRPLLTMPPR